MSATCSSTSEHHTRSTLAVVERDRPVRLEQPQVGAGRVAAGALQRRLGDLDADGVGARVAQRGDEAAAAAAEVEHALARPRLGEQQRPPALPRPRLGILRRVRPEGLVVGAHRRRGYAFVVRLRLIRHATVLAQRAGRRSSWTRCSIPRARGRRSRNTPNQRDNPLVELPEPAEVVVHGLDAIVVTHLHQDHFDATAAAAAPEGRAAVLPPDDAETLRGHGFDDVRPVDDRVDWEGIGDHARTGGVGTGADRRAAGAGVGLRPRDAGEPRSTSPATRCWCEEVRARARRAPRPTSWS